MNRIRLTALAALLIAAVPATGQAQTFWDFVALNGAPLGPAGTNPPVSYAGPYSVCNGGLGCVSFSSNNSSTQVLFKWNSDNSWPDDEKGVGYCNFFGGRVCNGDEVGDLTDWLLLDLSGLAPGTAVLSVTIASLDAIESYRFDLCATATTGCGSEITAFGGTPQSVWTVPVTQGSAQWIRFKPGAGNYLVQGITTTVPEPSTMGLLATGLVALTGAGIVRRRRNRK